MHLPSLQETSTSTIMLCAADKSHPQVLAPAAGHPMVPLSWQEMQCPQTKAVEKRKVAKVKA